MDGTDLHVALWTPEIPQNTGNIGRLCLGIGATLHLIHPLGFAIDERAVRRAGLDYWRHVKLVEHTDGASFLAWASGRRVVATSSHGTRPYTAWRYAPGDVLVFGRETVGLDPEVRDALPLVTIPMPGPIRSLNLSNAVTLVAYEALRQMRPTLFAEPA